MTPLVNAILGFCLAVVFLSVFSRKFIGLELACLVQIGFLSLIQNKEITTYLQPESQWSFVFGFNRLHFSEVPADRFRSPYALLGFYRHFGFSNNGMILLGGIIYTIAGVLLTISMLTSKSTSRRMKNTAYLVAN